MASAVVVSVSVCLGDLTVREAGSHIVSGLWKRPHGKEMTSLANTGKDLRFQKPNQ